MSLDCIAAMVENLLNAYVDWCGGEEYAGMIIHYLNSLGHAIHYIEEYDDLNMRGAFCDYIKKIWELRQVRNLKGLVRFGNEIIRILNESQGNLRLGNRRINVSISYSFDLKSWIYVSGGRYISNRSLAWQEGTHGT